MADMDTYEESGPYEGTYRTTKPSEGMQEYGYGYQGHNDRDYQAPRDRSRSPGPDRDGDTRIRDEPANGRDRGPPPKRRVDDDEDDESVNPGSNLFVTGIHPRLSESEISRLFEKYGDVEKCNIMRDPHTRESRGFGFVKMTTAEGADSAKEGLQGEVYEGRTLSIEKARRAKPRTPTPGKYFGPPKRDGAPPPRRGGYRDRYEDRGGSYGRRDDYRSGGGGGGGYRDRYEDRGDRGDRGSSSYGRRDEYAPRAGDRYRDDRYGGERGGGGERRGGGYGGGSYDRASRGPPAERYGGDAAPPARDAPPREYAGDRRAYD
ncbi:separin protein [Friedmanniomyces endolithicus]|nr:separin protein [Friedmanniomyces endolithicus]